MLAEKNKDIKKAYDILEIISKDEKARMAYEAREAEIRDQLIRIKTAEEKGMQKGIEKGLLEGKRKTAKNLFGLGLTIEEVSEAVELSINEVTQIQKEIEN